MEELQDILWALAMKHAISSDNFAGPDNETFTVGMKETILYITPNHFS